MRNTVRHPEDHADTALLLIDVVNNLEFDGGESLLSDALQRLPSSVASKRAGFPPFMQTIISVAGFPTFLS